jgi:peptidoglycan-associated lipoprotein
MALTLPAWWRKVMGNQNLLRATPNPDGSDNPTGRQRNRRTEFKILEIGALIKRTEEDDDEKFFRNELKKNDN